MSKLSVTDHLCHATITAPKNCIFVHPRDDVELACHSKDPRKIVGSKDLRKNFHFLLTMREEEEERKIDGEMNV